MGEVARSVEENSRKTYGVVPELFNIKNVIHTIDEEQITTKTMSERKTLMFERADAFVSLPGGFATFEKMFEVLVLKQLGYHNKPVVF